MSICRPIYLVSFSYGKFHIHRFHRFYDGNLLCVDGAENEDLDRIPMYSIVSSHQDELEAVKRAYYLNTNFKRKDNEKV